jgi:hypothetical protein
VAQKPTVTVFGTEGVESKAAVHTAVCSAAELSCRTELLGVHTPDIRHLGRGSEIRTRRPSLSGAYCHFGVGVRGMLTCCLICREGKDSEIQDAIGLSNWMQISINILFFGITCL